MRSDAGGERIGLLALDERYYTVYFAAFPIAGFDSQKPRVQRFHQAQGFDDSGGASPVTKVEIMRSS